MKQEAASLAAVLKTQTYKRKNNKMTHTYTRQGVDTNEVAKHQEKAQQSAMLEVLETLRKEYPNITFEHKKSISLKDWGFEKRRIIPDGGIIYATVDGKQYTVVASEKKYQKNKGANAIERLWFSTILLESFFLKEGLKSFPYAIFFDGAAFEEGCGTRDKIEGLLEVVSFRRNGVVPSFFMREKEWTHEEMYNECLNIAKNTLSEIFEH